MKKLLGLSLVMVSLFLPALGQGIKELPTITTKQYYADYKSKVSIVMFTMGDGKCIPCEKAKEKLMPRLLEEFANDDSVGVYAIDVLKDVAPDGVKLLHKRFAITSTPVFLVIVNDAEVLRINGFKTTQDSGSIKNTQQTIIDTVNHYK